MPKFYATFGCGHPLSEYALELKAKDEQQARAYMKEYFNNHYCAVYDEARWRITRRAAAMEGWMPEEILRTIDITEFTKD